MYTDEWLRVEGVWLHYQDWPADDPAGAETVLLLHGLTQQSHAFDAVATQLSRRHRCLALDLRGRGESGWAPGTYAIPQYVLDVLALLDRLGLEAVHLLGTSLGGLVGLSLAGAAPARLRSLCLNDIGPDIDPRGAARVAAYASTVPERFPDLDGAVAWAIEQYPWLAGRPPEAVAEAVRWAVRRQPDGQWRLKFDPEIGRAPRPAPEAARAASRAWWAALEALRCPSCSCVAERATSSRPRPRRRWRRGNRVSPASTSRASATRRRSPSRSWSTRSTPSISPGAT